ncbi:DUF6925 family protein [Methylobacterium goesingense]|uniref:Uncharacterized protein n=1 Tax=Methylobacterium goesingense TaxID=243690 RepID=A0ABV2L648_9HYPH|nr:hypothetical protein [Methylobacterium goesingense]GJD72408.1 hypothetical protein CFIICLFH_0622 [Methylobacterium goesingense]
MRPVNGAAEAVAALVADGLADPEATWSLGGFGALAEFGHGHAESGTRIVGPRPGLVTARGAIRLDPRAAIPVAYETAFHGGWSHAVALCLPTAHGAPNPDVLTESGPDGDAVRPENRGDPMFDLGLGLHQGRFVLRTSDPEALADLRRAVGLHAFDPAAPVLDLVARRAVDVVVVTPLGRIEVFAGAEPMVPGPRAFLAPRVLALGRTHAATASIPNRLMPVAVLHPAHPCRDVDRHPRVFDHSRHRCFQALHRRWGDPDLVALKERLVAGAVLDTGSATRRARNVARVVRVQADAMATMHDAGKSIDDTSR